MIVADASALLELLLRSPAAATIENRLFAADQTLHAPHLVDIEILHAARRYAAAGELGEQRGRALLADLADLPLRRYPHDMLIPRIWALRHNLSAYDAAYVALAELLEAPLVTRDRRLAAAPGHGARIELI